eukprot:Seg420.3 transcript_id=Seg420.3/GoldUCD/mRNA.D3Y31 product="Metabotropic glutamate receptor 7" protein_id=Seg420.3/GoldUCD/D3Y31
MAAFWLLFGFVYFTAAQYNERKAGEYILGAVIPIHEAGSTGNLSCGGINVEGVAIAEAFRLAVNTINKRSSLASGSVPRIFGYDLRDSCDEVERAKDIAYDFNKAHRKYIKVKSGPKPISVVLSKFNKAELQVMKLFMIESIPQISYTPDNVKLSPVFMTHPKDSELLFSTYPGDAYKVQAAAEVIRELGIEYFSVVVSDDRRGRQAEKIIQKKVSTSASFCHSGVIRVTSKKSLTEMFAKLRKQQLAKAVLLHANKQETLWAFEEARNQNISDVIWFSTMSWEHHKTDLEPYISEMEGIVNIENKRQEPTGFKLYLNRLQLPYKDNDLLQKLFMASGGAKECLLPNANISKAVDERCKGLHKEIIGKLEKYSSKVAYVIDAVFVFEKAIDKMLNDNKSDKLVKVMKSLDFISPMTQNPIQFDSEGVMLDVLSIVYNLQENMAGNSKKFEMIRVGRYDTKAKPKLYLNKEVMRWKNASRATPVSKCSADCSKGWQRIVPENGAKCCWKCTQCPFGHISKTNNSASCLKCGIKFVANPSQTSCVRFKQTSFRWFDPVGEFMIFLITAGLCATFFTLGIFSQNRECEFIKTAGYKMMVFMLFGVGLCFFTPVPLLLEPSAASCIAYVIMFNFGLTIPLAVLFIKSPAIRDRFYDENNELKNGSLGPMPNLVVIVILLGIQAIILGVGIHFTSIHIVYFPTKQWDLMYAECAYVKNEIFWVSFGYNVILSVVLNLLSFNGKKVEEHYKDQKWVCISACAFYLVSYLFITSLYSVYGSHVIEAASVIIILFGFMFILTYFGPKLRLVLYHQPPKPVFGPDGKPLLPEEEKEDKAPSLTAHMSAVDGFKLEGRHKILGMKIKSDSSSEIGSTRA